LRQPEKVSHLLALAVPPKDGRTEKEQETSVVAISKQYDVPHSTLYHWLSRHNAYHTYENRSTAPHTTHGKFEAYPKSCTYSTCFYCAPKDDDHRYFDFLVMLLSNRQYTFDIVHG